MIDLGSIDYILWILIPLIAISIAIVAFWNYLKIRSWKLLALSVAFALLAANELIPLINGNMLNYAILSAFSLLAFVILAYVYYSERKVRGIKITKLRWIIGSLVAICSIATLFYFTFVGNHYYELFPQAFLQDLIQSLLASATILLVIYTIISLYSYYHIVRNKNTLVVMAGFICLLSTYLLSLVLIIPPFKHLLVSNFDYITQLQLVLMPPWCPPPR